MTTYPWFGRENAVAEKIKLVLGSLILLVFLPYVAFQVAACTLWEFLDRKTIRMLHWCRKFSDWCGPKFHKAGYVARECDGFMVPVGIWLGVCLPAWFFYELWRAATVGFEWQRVVVYNLCRIGPMYFNFMYVYVLAHKEGHTGGYSLYTKPKIAGIPVFRQWFNGWIGSFHGVLPAAFPYSHNYNHHKYDNNQYDIICTAYRPRDSFKAWTTYLTEWMAYATNLSSIGAFLEEGAYGHAFWMTVWTAWYCLFVYLCWQMHALFTFCTIIYALVEGNILLSAVNWTWHAFIDPNDPQNDYINSITIIEGLNFTLGEEYHAVHHQYAGMHWTKNTELFEKHKDGYTAKGMVPCVFYKCNIFELWGNIVFKNYDGVANYFHEPYSQGKSKKELAELMKMRLQTHGPEIAKLQGKRGQVKVVRDGRDVTGDAHFQARE